MNRFSSFNISNQIFYQSKLSLGLVNLKPLVPGHVLVISKRIVSRLNDLTENEISDLFLSVQQISKLIQSEYNSQSMTISCQDGPAAGQTVPHVHVHVIPRTPNDFDPMDKIYDALDQNNLGQAYHSLSSTMEKREKRIIVDDESRIARGEEEMKEEAIRLSKLFPLEFRGTFS